MKQILPPNDLPRLSAPNADDATPTVFFLPALSFLTLASGLLLLFVMPKGYRPLFWAITVNITLIVFVFCTVLGIFHILVSVVIKRNANVHGREEQNEQR